MLARRCVSRKTCSDCLQWFWGRMGRSCFRKTWIPWRHFCHDLKKWFVWESFFLWAVSAWCGGLSCSNESWRFEANSHQSLGTPGCEVGQRYRQVIEVTNVSLTFNQLLGRDTGWKIQVPLDNGWTLMLSLHHLYHIMETVYTSATPGFISLSGCTFADWLAMANFQVDKGWFFVTAIPSPRHLPKRSANTLRFKLLPLEDSVTLGWHKDHATSKQIVWWADELLSFDGSITMHQHPLNMWSFRGESCTDFCSRHVMRKDFFEINFVPPGRMSAGVTR